MLISYHHGPIKIRNAAVLNGSTAIIADNCDGYLTSTRYGDRIEAGFDDVLKAKHDYYYHVPHPSECNFRQSRRAY
jgi:hypothetical protein